MLSSVKFCLCCGHMFEKKYNRYFEEAYKDKDCCCIKCERAYARKQRPHRGHKYGVTGYIYHER